MQDGRGGAIPVPRPAAEASEDLQRVRVVARKEGYEPSDTYTTLGTTALPIKLRPATAAKEDR